MSTDEIDLSLIDWSGPVMECINMPLIPLPTFNSQIQITEDPFDVAEKQIDDNEPFDIFSKNSNENYVFNKLCDFSEITNNCPKEEGSPVVGELPKILNVFHLEEEDNIDVKELEKLNSSVSCHNDMFTLNNDLKLKEVLNNRISNCISEASHKCVNLDSVSCHNDLLTLNTSTDLELKEVVNNRISNCISEALHKYVKLETVAESPSEPSFVESFSPIYNDTNTPTSIENKTDSFLNDGFMSSNECKEKHTAESINSLFLNTFGETDNDLRLLVPHWDEITINSNSSSDEENEKPSKNFDSSKKSCNVSIKKMNESTERHLNSTFPKSSPIRVKKSNNVFKQGPLKAVIPVENMRKSSNQKKSVIITDRISSEKKIRSVVSITRQKRWSAPIATSTPTDCKFSTPTKIPPPPCNKRIIAKNSKSSSIDSICPPSPDSTSSYRHISRLNISNRVLNNKGCIKKLNTNVVSSSTSIVKYKNSPKKLLKDMKNYNLKEAVMLKSSEFSTKPNNKSVRINKENIAPMKSSK